MLDCEWFIIFEPSLNGPMVCSGYTKRYDLSFSQVKIEFTTEKIGRDGVVLWTKGTCIQHSCTNDIIWGFGARASRLVDAKRLECTKAGSRIRSPGTQVTVSG